MTKPLVDWGFGTGRTYLTVAGYIVAMEGDPVRDMNLGIKLEELLGEKYKDDDTLFRIFSKRQVWTGELIKFVCAEANGGELPR